MIKVKDNGRASSHTLRRIWSLGPAEGCMIPVDAFPFCLKAEGAYFWDVDGSKYLILCVLMAPMFWDITTPM